MYGNVIVIGGGAAGCLAACEAAKNGNAVTLIEKNQRIGRKVLITGKGRCNLTNYKLNINELIENVPVNGKFLYGAFKNFMPTDTMALFEELGVPLKVERGDRVFPVSDKAQDIVDAMDRYLRKSHVKRVNDRVIRILTENGKVKGVETEKCGIFSADSVIIATGGSSYPRTGSTGDGYKLAMELGHTITPVKPSLVPLVSKDGSCKEMQGLSLRNIEISVVNAENGKTIYTDFGEMLFTHFGVSGPVILSASSHLRDLNNKRYTLSIDLKPALSEEKLNERLLRDFAENPNKDFINCLGGLLPRKMIPVFARKCKIRNDKKVNQLTKEERQQIIKLLKNFEISIDGFRPIDEAIVTSGGINVKEITPKSMESKIVEGLFFAGEVIDVDAYTGGYNLQIAFSTGVLAGQNA